MLTPEELRRYRRQLPLLDEAGQENLKAARVLIAGVGGLGTVIAVYLAAAGVGTLRIADCDRVEESNLNRQILHWNGDLGGPKTASAARKLAALNPLIRLEPFPEKIDDRTVEATVKGCDVVVDAMDNFSTRYLLNRTAISVGIAFVHGAVRGFCGQATTVLPGKTPCLRCIIPSAPPPDTLPVIGVTCGVIGSIEATEVVKLLTGRGVPLAGRLFLWDGLALNADILAVERNPACPDCGSPGEASR
jgi:adenylyltransferase/sulfurtransferase